MWEIMVYFPQYVIYSYDRGNVIHYSSILIINNDKQTNADLNSTIMGNVSWKLWNAGCTTFS